MARQINEIWEHHPRKGEYYLFGRIGSGKNAYIKTLASAKSRASLQKKRRQLGY